MEETVKKSRMPVILIIFILALSFTACDDVFTSGWGSPREYSVGNINLTVNNVDRWFDRSIGNPPLAMRVNEAILIRLADPNLSPEERRIFQIYGIRIAVASSNMGVIILSNALTILTDMADGLSDEEMANLLKDMLGKIQNDFRNAGGGAAAESIVQLIFHDIIPGTEPTFHPDSFVRDANPSDVAKTIMVLTLAETENRDMDIDDWDNFELEEVGLRLNAEGNKVIPIDAHPSDTLLALAAYLNLVNNEPQFDDNFLLGPIREAFFSGNEAN